MSIRIFASLRDSRLLAVWIVLLSLLGVRPAWPDAGKPVSTGQELPPLPEVPKPAFPGEATAEALKALDAHLERLQSSQSATRSTAHKEVLEVAPSVVPAIHRRINDLARNAKRKELEHKLSRIRSKARQEVRKRMRAEGKRGKVATPDYLEMLLEHAEPKSEQWRVLVVLLGMSRMLEQLGSPEAVHTLIHLRTRFEFLRVDTQLQLEALGERAVPALIETRQHKAASIGRWADRQLDALGKGIPSEAVQVSDQAVLPDVLRAYGRTKDPDATRVVVSFANSERAQVREAARQAIVMMGDVATWQLRETHESLLGKKPPRDWSWQRLARELFAEFDRIRLAQVYKLYDLGMAAYERGALVEMREAFNKLLAHSPMFDQRAKLAPGYLAYAKKYLDEKPDEALDALYRAKRVHGSGDSKTSSEIESLLLTLEAEALAKRGVVDHTLLERAIELDSENRRARDALEVAQHGELAKQSRFERYVAAGAIAAFALVAILVIAFRRPRSGEQPAAPGSTKPPSTPEAAADEDGAANQPGTSSSSGDEGLANGTPAEAADSGETEGSASPPSSDAPKEAADETEGSASPPSSDTPTEATDSGETGSANPPAGEVTIHPSSSGQNEEECEAPGEDSTEAEPGA